LITTQYALVAALDILRESAQTIATSGLAGSHAVSRDLHLARQLITGALERIDKPLTLEANGTVILDGSGSGDIIVVESPDVTLRGFTIRNTGIDLDKENAAIRVIAPRVTLRPDEKAQNWLLNISASDRLGLLYSIARVLAQHHIVVQLAKVATLGERVEDTFLIHGAPLQHNKTQIAIETELLEALAS
jgi:hypothetical protein